MREGNRIEENRGKPSPGGYKGRRRRWQTPGRKLANFHMKRAFYKANCEYLFLNYGFQENPGKRMGDVKIGTMVRNSQKYNSEQSAPIYSTNNY